MSHPSQIKTYISAAFIREDGSIGELSVAKGVCSLSKAAADRFGQMPRGKFLRPRRG
jgi:hypothetical protein